MQAYAQEALIIYEVPTVEVPGRIPALNKARTASYSGKTVVCAGSCCAAQGAWRH
jgi:hypothetical protein